MSFELDWSTSLLLVLFFFFICGLCSCVAKLGRMRRDFNQRIINTIRASENQQQPGNNQSTIFTLHEPKKQYNPDLDQPPQYWEVIESPHIFVKPQIISK